MELMKGWDRPLKHISHGKEISEIILAALSAAEPAVAVRKALRGEDDFFLRETNQNQKLPFHLISIGKAAIPMAEAAIEALPVGIMSGIVITKALTKNMLPPERVQVFQADHPVPGKASLLAGQALCRFVAKLEVDARCLILISGGGSALVTMLKPGVSLDDLQKTTRLLLNCGATIAEINCVRKHLDQIKGGGLARMLNSRKCLALILSDVMGDHLSAIASGPLSADETTFSEALAVFRRYKVIEQVPQSILSVFQKGESGGEEETLKPGDPILNNIRCKVIANNRTAVDAAEQRAKSLGWQTADIGLVLMGEARQMGKTLAERIKNEQPVKRPVCLVAGGETTVTIHGSGLGGRNLETALGAVQELRGVRDAVLITLATDGDDGNSGAAGAVVTGDTYDIGHHSGMEPEDYLSENNSRVYFEQQKSLLVTGPTGTNVNDLAILIRG